MRRGVLAASVGLALVACDGGTSRAPASPRGELSGALDAVCRAVTLAGEGNIGEAARVFEDRAHAFLHELAAKGADAAPAPTARMLQSKREAEAAFAAEGPPDPATVQHLVDLHDSARELARELGMSAPPRCQGAVA